MGLSKHAAQGRVGEARRRLPHVGPTFCVRAQMSQELREKLPTLPRSVLPQAPALRKDKEGRAEVSHIVVYSTTISCGSNHCARIDPRHYCPKASEKDNGCLSL